MHPHLDLLDELIRVFGYPALLGVLVWAIRTWDNGHRDVKYVVQTVTTVKDTVTTMQTNHLAHLQDGITKVAASNDKAVDLLQDIKTGIEVLIDRTPRI